VFIIFFIGSIAETNRAPFDLAEAESELVSGFMTEHAAVIFVFFFLAEYASIILMCILTSILFLGGYIINIIPLYYIIYYIDISTLVLIDFIDYTYEYIVRGTLSYQEDIEVRHPKINIDYNTYNDFLTSLQETSKDPILENLYSSLILGIKSIILIFIFI
jgi:NADH-ubiquinone oxidoreductase chain 1